MLKGHGNDGHSGFEGARAGNTIGTYLHGPLLPKNTWFADWLIATALGVDVGALAPLDDALSTQLTPAPAALPESDDKVPSHASSTIVCDGGCCVAVGANDCQSGIRVAPGWSSTLPPAANKLLDPVLTELQLACARGIATRLVSGRVSRLGLLR